MFTGSRDKRVVCFYLGQVLACVEGVSHLIMAGMDFSFPFATLRQVSLKSIGERLINNTGRVAGFPDRPIPPEASSMREVSSQYLGVVETLPVPHKLQREVFAMSMGMYEQLWNWLDNIREDVALFRWYNEKEGAIEPIFDVEGVVDESRTWQNYFDRIRRMENISMQDLQTLLLVACRRTLVPQISETLSNILTLEGTDAAVLVGPYKEFDNQELLLIYTFDSSPTLSPNVSSSHSAYEIFRWLHTTEWEDASFSVIEGGMAIFLNPFHNKISFVDYWINLMENSGNTTILFELDYHVIRHWIEHRFTEYIVTLMYFLNPVESQRKFLSGMDGMFDINELLSCFLRWPFSRWFMPVVTFLSEDFRHIDYINTFDVIVRNIFGKCDVFGYANLLLDFWNTFPLDLKREFRNDTTSAHRSPDIITIIDETMTKLFNKNATLYSIIVVNACFCELKF